MTEQTASVGEQVDPAQLLLTPEQVARVLAVGRTTLYALLGQGVIESVKVGALRRVPRRAVEDYVDRLRQEGMVG